MSAASTPGACRHCGCTEWNPCMLAHGETCCWISGDRTVCSNPDCIIAEGQRLAALRKPDRYKNWGPGAKAMEARRLERNRRARAARARQKLKAKRRAA